MGVIGNMVFTVAIITIAPGTVAKFQFRIGNIRAAADRAPVEVGGFGSRGGVTVGKGDHLWSRFLGGLVFPEQAASIDPPAEGDYIHHALSEEQKVVCNGNQRKKCNGQKSRGNGRVRQDYTEHGYNVIEGKAKIQNRKNPCLYRNDEE